jgi:beta-lactamase regulating signal transducer with metallopeptidase domain
MGWKSAVIAGAALLILNLLRSRAPADRASVLQLAVVSLLLLPLVSFALPSLQLATPMIAAPTADSFSPAAAARLEPSAVITPVAMSGDVANAAAAFEPVTPASQRLPLGLMLQLGYGLGVVLLLGRLAAGLLTLRRWTMRGVAVTETRWTAALDRARAAAGVEAPVRLLASDHAPSPLSWGVLRPVILIDRASLARPQYADAILAHEVAHVARRDWLSLMLSRLAVALFWLNPLVWLVERALVQDVEEAADDQAIDRVEPVAYARTLLACVRSAAAMPAAANSMAATSGLSRRVAAILDDKRRRAPAGSLRTTLAMAACIALSGPVAALELVASDAPGRPTSRSAPYTALDAPQGPDASDPVAAADAQAEADAEVTPILAAEDLEVREAMVISDRHVADAAAAAADAVAAEQDRAVLESDRDAEVEARAEAAAEARAEAFERAAEARADAAEALAEARAAARSHAVAQAVAIARARDSGHERLTPSQLMQLKVHGVDEAYVRDIASIGPRYQNLAPSRLVLLKVHGVTAETARRMAAAGVDDVSPEHLAQFSVHGVTPEYVRDMRAAGFGRLSAGQLVQARIHGVSPASAKGFVDLGYRALTTGQLVQMAIHGVSPAYVRALQAAGLGDATPSQLVQMRIHGVSPEIVRRGREAGRRVTPETLVQMQIHGEL